MTTSRRRALGLGALIVAVVVIGLAVRAIVLFNEPPTFSCSTPNAKACADTEASIRGDKRFVFVDDLPGRLAAVDIRPAQPGWDEGYWAALLTIDGHEPMLMRCYYSSDKMVGCDPAPS